MKMNKHPAVCPLCGGKKQAGKTTFTVDPDFENGFLNTLLALSDKDRSLYYQVIQDIYLKFGYVLDSLFNPLSKANKKIFDLFNGHQDSLEKAYMVHIKVDKNADCDGTTFARILSVTPDFILKYIDRVYDGNESAHSYLGMRDYTFVWQHNDCDYIMSCAVVKILKYEKRRGYILGNTCER